MTEHARTGPSIDIPYLHIIATGEAQVSDTWVMNNLRSDARGLSIYHNPCR